MYVCLCHGITDRTIREAAASGVRDIGELAAATGCTTGCGSCADLASSLLDDYHASQPLPLRLLPMAA